MEIIAQSTREHLKKDEGKVKVHYSYSSWETGNSGKKKLKMQKWRFCLERQKINEANK